MKTLPTLAVSLLVFPVVSPAQPRTDAPLEPERPPVSRSIGPADKVLVTDNQKLYASPEAFVSPEQARAVVAAFVPAYEKLGRPRLLFYVNRDLVEPGGGLKLTKRTEHIEADRATGGTDAPGSERVSADHTYEAKDAPAPSLADRQTVRDVERLFGRPFRNAGATLADQAVAATLIESRPFNHFAAADDDRARRQREALTKVADVVIEVLISTRRVTVPEASGDRTYVLPDIQATAIRLSDSAILGQATARDVIGPDRDAGRVAAQFDVNDVAEATALALMEDITQTAK